MSEKSKAAGKPDAKPPETQNEDEAVDMVLISTNHRQARRRAGMRFTPEGVTIDPAQLTEKQRTAIAADPYLVVKPVQLKVEG